MGIERHGPGEGDGIKREWGVQIQRHGREGKYEAEIIYLLLPPVNTCLAPKSSTVSKVDLHTLYSHETVRSPYMSETVSI